MDKELWNIKTEINIMEISKWEKKMGRVNLIIIMEIHLQENLQMILMKILIKYNIEKEF